MSLWPDPVIFEKLCAQDSDAGDWILARAEQIQSEK